MVTELFRDQDVGRLSRRISAVSQGELGGSKIRRLIDGDTHVLVDTSERTRRSLRPLLRDMKTIEASLPKEDVERVEALIGPDKADWLPIAYVDLVRRAANAVARIALFNGTKYATGVLISPRLIMTNQHVIKNDLQARDFKAQFGYETSIGGEDLPSVDIRLDPDDFFWCSPQDELDAAIVAIDERAAPQVKPFGWAPLSAATGKHAIGDFVTIVQHPDGARKQVALRENRILGRGKRGTTLHYSADTVTGSSGSPVFNDQLELVALHHGWGPDNEQQYEDGTSVPDASNEGIRVSCIVDALRVVLPSLDATPAALLRQALDGA